MNDPRFVREGRGLEQWLPELLGPDRLTRRRAENVVSAMWWGAPVADTTVHEHAPPDRGAHERAFGAAIAAVLLDPAFDGPHFIAEAMRMIQDDYGRRDRQFELEDSWLDSEDPASDDGLERVLSMEAREMEGQLPNSLGPLALRCVLHYAGPVLLRVPDLVRSALGNALRSDMAKALENLGPQAAMFLPELLEPQIDSEGKRSLLSQETLASVARDDIGGVRALVDMLETDLRDHAASTLRLIGMRAAELAPDVVDRMMRLAAAEGRDGIHLLYAASVIAPARRDLFERILQAARPAPPDIQYFETSPDNRHPYDAAMFARGAALEALRHFPSFAVDAVPVLIGALDDFVEFDPDWGYQNGAHGRVIDALSRLGGAASAAVPAVLSRLKDKDGEIDWRIVRFLGGLGPAAAAALPALHRLATEIDWAQNSLTEPGETPNEVLDSLGWAMWRIQGSPR